MARMKTTEAPETGNAVVPLPAPQQPFSAGVIGGIIQVPEPGTPLHMCPSSLDMSDPEGFRLAFNATGEADIELSKEGEAIVRARHWLIHPGEAVDEETGELRRFPRLVLIQRDGRMFATTSEVVMDRLAQLVHYYGERRWEEVTLRIIERRAKRSGRRYHDLRIIPPEE